MTKSPHIIQRKCTRRLSVLLLGLLCALGVEAQPWFCTTDRTQGLPDNYVSTLAEDGDGFVWAGTLGGITRFDGYRHRVYGLMDNEGRSDNNVTALWMDHGQLWARSVVGNLYQYDSARDEFVFLRTGARPLGTTTTVRCGDDHTWTATDSRGLLLKGADGTETWLTAENGKPYSLPSNHLNTLLLTRSGVLFVGTSKAGLAYANLHTAGVQVIDTQADEDISFVRQWGGGLWLVGYDGKGLALVNDAGKTLREWNSHNSPLTCDVVTGCFADRDGSLLISTYGGGVFRMKDGRIAGQVADGKPALRYVRKVGYDAQGQLWLGSMKDGLSRLNNDGTLTTCTYKNSALNTTCITDIAYCMRSRRLYVATSTGLCFVDEKGTLKQASDSPDDGVRLSQLHIRTLAVDAEGRIYAGTDNGIRVYDRAFKPVGTPLLPGSEILALAADKAGHVYATTAVGIYRVSPTNGCQGIGREHGLAQVGLAKYALSVTPEGEVLAGGLGRFVRLSHTDELFADSHKMLRITELRINGERIAGGDTTVTLGSHGRLLVSVATLDYGRASTMVFAYRLDEGQWQAANGNTIIVDNLPVGGHRLTVRASNGAEVGLTVSVPWWRSAWGFVPLYVIIGAGGFLLWRSRRKKNTELSSPIGKSDMPSPSANSGREPLAAADRALTDKATAIVEAHLSDNDFSVEAFGEAMCLSRSALYKKLMAATGQSPLEFMRGIRLNRGRQLLEQGETSISQIATRVGMSPKQFSRFFREQYGVLPSEYLMRRKE